MASPRVLGDCKFDFGFWFPGCRKVWNWKLNMSSPTFVSSRIFFFKDNQLIDTSLQDTEHWDHIPQGLQLKSTENLMFLIVGKWKLTLAPFYIASPDVFKTFLRSSVLSRAPGNLLFYKFQMATLQSTHFLLYIFVYNAEPSFLYLLLTQSFIRFWVWNKEWTHEWLLVVVPTPPPQLWLHSLQSFHSLHWDRRGFWQQ